MNSICEFVSVSIPILINLFYQLKVRKLPIHPDSGLFLYATLMSKEGYKLIPGKYLNYKNSLSFHGDYLRLFQKYFLFIIIKIFFYFVPSNPKNFRYLFAFYNSLNILMVYSFSTLLFGHLAGITSAFIFTIICLDPFSDSSELHIEHFAILPFFLVLSIFYQLVQSQNNLLFILAGIFSAILILLFKITFLLEIIVATTTLFATNSFNFLFFVGFLFIFGIIFFLAWINGELANLKAMLNPFQFLYYKNKIRNKNKTVVHKIKLLFKISKSIPFFMLVIGSYFLSIYNFSLGDVFISALFFATCLGVFIQGQFYLSHLFSIISYIPFFLGKIVINYHDIFTSEFHIFFFFLVLLILFFYWLYDLYVDYFKNTLLQFFLKKCSLGNYPSLSFLAEEIIATFIRTNSSKTDKIIQWGYNHELYVLAKRRSALGKKLEYSLLTDPIISDSYYGNSWRQWLLDSITDQKPKFITDMRGSLNINALNKSTGLNYKLEKLFYGLFPLYKLIDSSFTKPIPIDVTELTTFPKDLKVHNHFQNQETYINYITDLVNHGQLGLANDHTNGQITQLFKDWETLNKL